jgi:hypothetical protein
LEEALRILVAEKSSFSEHGLQAFAELGPTEAMDLTQAELESLISGYNLLVIRLGLQVNRAVFARGDQLKGVATPPQGRISLISRDNSGQ